MAAMMLDFNPPAALQHLILVKHAMPVIEAGRPAREWRLGEVGRARCADLAAGVRAFGPAGPLVSSDEPKAVETAQRVADALALPTAIEPDLAEHRRGHARLLSDADFQAAIAALFARPDERVFGEETAQQARDRFARGAGRALAGSSARCRMLVAHGTVISLFTAALTGVDGHALWKRLDLPSAVVLARAGTGWTLAGGWGWLPEG